MIFEKQLPVVSCQLPEPHRCALPICQLHIPGSVKRRQFFSGKSFEWNILTCNSFRWNILRGSIFSPLLFSIFCRHTVGGGCNQLVNNFVPKWETGER